MSSNKNQVALDVERAKVALGESQHERHLAEANKEAEIERQELLAHEINAHEAELASVEDNHRNNLQLLHAQLEQEKEDIIVKAELAQDSLQEEVALHKAEFDKVKSELNATSSKYEAMFESMITRADHERLLEDAKQKGEADLADVKGKLTKSQKIEIDRLERRKKTEIKAIASQVRTYHHRVYCIYINFKSYTDQEDPYSQ